MKLALSFQCMNSSSFAVSKRSELIQLSHNIWLTLTASPKASCAEMCSEIPDIYGGGLRKASVMSHFK